MSTQQTMTLIFQAAFPDARWLIEDESHQHRGRAGQESHFKVWLESGQFHGLSRVERSRRVHELLKNCLMPQGTIHALTLRLVTPEEVAKDPALIERFSSPACVHRSS